MIPRIIHQTWKTKESNESIDKLRQTWIENNRNYEYNYYSDDDIYSFIKEHFDEKYVNAYSRIINGSLKADFFRYCVLFVKGGVYVDIDISCVIPLDDVVDLDTISFVTTTDYCSIQKSDRIYQGFLGCKPKCKLFINVLDKICDSMHKNQYKFDLFELSGPVMFSRLLKEYMNDGIEYKQHKINFLKELVFDKASTQEIFVILTHNIRNETLEKDSLTFAKSQHNINRNDNLHYFKNKNKFRKGFYI